MTESIPIEIVLKIVSEYFQEVTKKTFFGLWDRNNSFPFTMKMEKFSPNQIAENVRAAKNFRLVCTDMARAYCPGYIERNIGGSLFRKQYLTLLRLNGELSTFYLKPLHARVLLQKYYDAGQFYRATSRSSRKEFDAKDYYEIVTRDPMMILNNDFMNELTQDNMIIKPSLIGFDFRALYPSLMADITREDPFNDPELRVYWFARIARLMADQ